MNYQSTQQQYQRVDQETKLLFRLFMMRGSSVGSQKHKQEKNRTGRRTPRSTAKALQHTFMQAKAPPQNQPVDPLASLGRCAALVPIGSSVRACNQSQPAACLSPSSQKKRVLCTVEVICFAVCSKGLQNAVAGKQKQASKKREEVSSLSLCSPLVSELPTSNRDDSLVASRRRALCCSGLLFCLYVRVICTQHSV